AGQSRIRRGRTGRRRRHPHAVRHAPRYNGQGRTPRRRRSRRIGRRASLARARYPVRRSRILHGKGLLIMSEAGRTDIATRFMNASPERVYAAMVDPDALVAWLPPEDMSGIMHSFDGREGGGYRMELVYGD